MTVRDYDTPQPDKVQRVGKKERAKRKRDEARRVSAVKDAGQVPDDCGPAREAPARGAFRAVETYELLPGGARRRGGHKGRRTIHMADSFDVAMAQAKRNDRPEPFTASQIAIGRAYRDLVERFEVSGMRGASLEIMSGNGDPHAFHDAILRDGKRLRVLQHRIGNGSAMTIRRVRPSKRGTRVGILDRTLVDCFVLQEVSIADILVAHGWSVYSGTTKTARDALRQALDRMIGPVSKGIKWTRFGADLVPIWDQIDNICEK